MTDWNDHEPIYLQLAHTVLDRIMRGTLAECEPIPSVRQVASQERINPVTVSRGYQLLVSDGLLEKRRGLGMFVAACAQKRALTQERSRFLGAEWPRIRQRIALLDLSLDQLLDEGN